MNQPSSNKNLFPVYLPLLIGGILGLGIFLGYVLSASNVKPKTVTVFGESQKSKLDEVLNYIERNYVDTVNGNRLFDKAIREIFANLDPHSFYIPAKDLANTNELLDGELEGIGIEFNIINDTLLVVSPLPGGPSEEAGLLSGDKIIRVNDTLIAGTEIDNQKVQRLLKGKKGSTVKLSIKRNGSKDLLDFTLKRDKVQINSILAAYMIDDQIGYIKISKFSAKTDEEFHQSLKKLKSAGMTKLIVDLRGNGGGYLGAAAAIADELIAGNDLLVYTEGRQSPRENIRASSKGLFENGELLIMINEGSASASEILAGAVQDLNRGVIVGRRSFGKGLVQRQFELEDGSAIRLTTARYYTPSGRMIQRPYDGGVEEYYEDYYNRPEDAMIDDSIAAMDTVLWGIKPDIFIPIDTSYELGLARLLMSNGKIQEFAYNYFNKHQKSLRQYANVKSFKSDYQLPDAAIIEFEDFLKKSKVDLKTTNLRNHDIYVRLAIKAFIARQLFFNEGYQEVWLSGDRELQQALKAFREPKIAG